MSDCFTAFRRVRGAAADELFVLCRPTDGAASVARQSEAAYSALLELLSGQGVGPDAVVRETLFFRRIRQDFSVVIDARFRVLGKAGLPACRAAMTCIEQPPLSDEACFELAVVAQLPHPEQSWSLTEVDTAPSCSCRQCTGGARANVVRLGEQTSVHAGDIRGSGNGVFEQTGNMFRAAEGLLHEAGMSFRDVIRTWIYLRDIDRDYDDLNRARREFFDRCGLERRPASTGVQGAAFADAHDVSMGLYAVKSSQPLQVTLMSTTTLNEAWTYGADFSRGLRIVDANKTALYVSGTASIDETGQSVHVGDFAGQADRMLRNITSLLAAQGASFRDIVSAVTYLKHPGDAPALREIFRNRGFDGFPSTLVAAPLCRPELLCEAEALAIVAPPRSGG